MFSEDKWITWEDAAVSCQHWENHSQKALTLRFESCGVFSVHPQDDGCAFTWNVNSHDFVLAGGIATLPERLCREGGMVLLPGETLDLRLAAALDNRAHAGEKELVRRARTALTGDDLLSAQEEAYGAWFQDIPSFHCSDPLLETTWWYRWYLARNSYAEPDAGNFHHGVFYEGRSHKVVKDVLDPWGHEFSQLIPMSTPMHLIDCRWKQDGRPCREAMASLLDTMDADGAFRTMMMDKFSFVFPNFSQWAIYQYLLVHDDDFDDVKAAAAGAEEECPRHVGLAEE